MDAIDPKYIIAEIAARHGVKIDAKDPMMAVVTLNELVLMQLITPVIERIKAAGPEFEEAARRTQRLAGKALAESVMEAAFVLRTEIQNDIEGARLNASKLILELNEAHNRNSLFRLVALSLMCAVIIFALGFWIGWKL
jgi:hypothetical protein